MGTILPKGCTQQDYMYELRKIQIAESANFHRMFKVPMEKYWNNLTAFDIIKFDADIIKSGHETPRIVLEQKFGTDAVALVRRLLDTPRFEGLDDEPGTNPPQTDGQGDRLPEME